MSPRERMMKVAYMKMCGHTYVQIGMEMRFSTTRAKQYMDKFTRDCHQQALRGYSVDLLHGDREMFLQLSRMQDWVEFLAEDKE